MYFEHQSVRYKAEYLLIFDKKNKQRHRTFRDFFNVNEETCNEKYENFEELTYDFQTNVKKLDVK